MAVTIVATSGLATSNSFATVAEADTYLEARLNSSLWTGTEPKKIALVEAGRELNSLRWAAQRTFDTQAMAWPQRYALDPDAPAVTGISDIAQLYFDDGLRVTAGAFVVDTVYVIVTVGTTSFTAIGASANTVGVEFTATGVGSGTGTAATAASVPTRVKNAQIELAFEFLKAGTVDIAVADPNTGVITRTVDVLSTTWQAYARPTGLARYPRVVAYIAPMLASSSGSIDIARS